MPGAPPRPDRKETIVTAACGGVDKELLRIRELPGCNLLLTLRNAEYPIIVGTKTQRVVEQRYSLHCDPRSQAITIKHALRLADGRMLTIATFACDGGTARAWPIFSRLVPDLSPRHFGHRGGTPDATVRIADYDPAAAGLCYSVVAHRHQKIAPSRDKRTAAFAHLAFREFDISIVARVTGRPSADGALMHHRAETEMPGAAHEAISEGQLVAQLESTLRQLSVAGHSAAVRHQIAR